MIQFQTLNLDREFVPIIGDVQSRVGFTTLDFYSGLEPHIKIDPLWFNQSDDYVTIITCRPKNGNDLMRVFLATNAIRQLKPNARIWLFMPFVPFARQDRVCDVGEPLSVEVFADIINLQNYERVFVFDPHSDVAPALIKNRAVIPNHEYIKSVIADLHRRYSDLNLCIASPDAGAYKKIFATSRAVGFEGDIIICDKVRDVKTGKIVQTTVNTTDLGRKDVLIVDDICDGGRTFISIAEELYKRNAGRIFLAVTYGIFSNGFDILSDHFTHIYCTDLLRDIYLREANQDARAYGKALSFFVTQVPILLMPTENHGLITTKLTIKEN